MKPTFSFVVTARNDNYGGNWVNRINAFLKVLAYQADRTELLSELVFVEYNPPQDKKPMSQELSVPLSQYLSVRFITVPQEFHMKLPRSNEVSVCEFIGKNIGIRRAKGTYILATNPDVLFSDELFDFLKKGNLRDDIFHRVNRDDTSVDFIPPNLSPREILKTVRKKVVKKFFPQCTQYVSFWFWLNDFIHGRSLRLFKACPIFNGLRVIKDTIHENAAGDFLLMHSKMWHDVRGYDQITVCSGILDSYILYMLYCKGYKQNILPYAMFHLHHHHKGVKYLASAKQLREDANLMLKTKNPYKEYSPNWGFPEITFPEN